MPERSQRNGVTTHRHPRWRLGWAAALTGLTAVALSAWPEAAGAAAGVSASIKKGVLTVTGTTAAEAIALRLRAGDPNTLEVDVAADGSADFAFDRRRFQAIEVDGRGGDDNIRLDQ
jgi:hypothetical protein